MRKDMHKVVIERPRTHDDMAQVVRREKARGAKDPDTFPKNQPMSRGRGSKVLSDFLNPLIGFLRKQVGKKWDDVYSEVTDIIPGDSTIHLHILDHLRDMVQSDVRMVDGVAHELVMYSGHGWEPITSRSSRWPSFYVNPDDGKLCMAPEEDRARYYDPRKPPAEHDPSVFRILESEGEGPGKTPVRIAKLIDGCWFEVKLKRHDKGNNAWPYMSWQERDRRFIEYGSRDVYPVGKRTLSKKELRDLGLRSGR